MKKKLIVFVAFGILCIVFISMLCSGIFDRDVNMQSAEIYVGHSRYVVKSDGTLQVTFEGDNYFDPDIERSKKLTRKQREDIDLLIEEAKANRKRIHLGDNLAITDADLIYAIIDGEQYTSFTMSTHEPYGNPNALQKLTYKLVDISPIRKDNGRIRLEVLGELWFWGEPGLYVRLGERVFRMFYYDMPLMIICTLPLGLLIGMLFGLFAIRLNKKWLHIVPYAISFVGMAISFVLMFAIDDKYFVVYMYSISTGIFALIAHVITALLMKHSKKRKSIHEGAEYE